MHELVIATSTFSVEDEAQPLLNAFLDQVSLDSGEHEAAEFEDSVQLMTLHSAKGLEFPLVFLVGMEESLPHQRSMDDPTQLEEERRLCYVGITRAMQKLFLTYAESRRLYGSDNSVYPPLRLVRFPKNICRKCACRPVLVGRCRPRTTIVMAAHRGSTKTIPASIWGNASITSCSVKVWYQISRGESRGARAGEFH